MREKLILVVAIVLSLAASHAFASADGIVLTGTVFEDSNANGVFDQGEPALPGTAVSDGRDVVVTDGKGRYRIATEADILFVSVPGSYHAARNEFYRNVRVFSDSDRTIDFPLVKNKSATNDAKFTFAFVTDTHVAAFRNAKEGVAKAYRDVEKREPAFVIHGGDIVFDAAKTADTDLAEAQYALYKNELAPTITAPFYHSIGNHDVFAWAAVSDSDPKPPLYGKKMFNKYFGPTHYSFNYGRCHFVVIDSIGKIKAESGGMTYHGAVDNVQFEWLKKDLALVRNGAPIIIVSHIPTINALASLFGTESELVTRPDGTKVPKHQIDNLAGVLGDALRQRNFRLALAGHYHTFEEVHWKSNEHDALFIVGGSICGGWWKGDHRLGLSSWPEGFTLVDVDGERFTASYIPYGWRGTEE